MKNSGSNEHRMFWRPDRAGYTMLMHQAGRYSLNDATRICRMPENHIGLPDEVMLLAPSNHDAVSAFRDAAFYGAGQ
ncbi:MAG TPA: hypothetical protein VNY08_14155 [Bradyrhizobium sp.]|nr:hypothetical protein [Bradyrhizobium sp.]